MSSSPRDSDAAAVVTSPRRGRWGRLPLRTKLIAVFTVVIICVSLAIGGITQALITRYLTDQLDRQVAAAAIRLAGPPGQLAPPPTGPGVPGVPDDGVDDDDPGEALHDWLDDLDDSPLCSTNSYPNGPGGRQPDDSVFALYSSDGGALRLSAAIRGTYPSCTVLTGDQAAPLTTVPTGGRISTVDLGTLGQYRVTAHTFEGTTFVSGLSTASITATRTQLITILAIVTASAVLIGGLAVWWSLRRSLTALERVAATAKQATALPLHRGSVELAVRVPPELTDTRTEAGTVGAALNQLLAHVEEALTAREQSEGKVRQFVADASHELRTPLTAIRGYAELAGRHPDDVSGVRHALSRVQAESTRMSALVEDLLLLARLDAGRPLTLAPVDVTALAVDAVADARVASPDHRWTVNVPDQPVYAAGDSARITQILTNLLANARTHTPAGTTVTVDVEAGGGGSVIVRVRDDGPGIPEEIRASVFDRFVRGDTSRSRGASAAPSSSPRVGSTGLGLAIVASLAQAHGGSVTLETAPGRTVFTVALPAVHPGQAAVPGAATEADHSAGTGNEG